MMCPRCGGCDPQCKMCPNLKEMGRRAKEEKARKSKKKFTPEQLLAKKKQKEKDDALHLRDKWIANIWIKLWKYAMGDIVGNEEKLVKEFKLNPEIAKQLIVEARRKFGDWVVNGERKPVPPIVNDLLKVPI